MDDTDLPARDQSEDDAATTVVVQGEGDGAAREFSRLGGRCWEKTLSIGGVVGALSVLSIALSLLLSGVLFETTCDNALGQYWDLGVEGLDQCYATAETMMYEATMQSLRPLAGSIATEIGQFFDQAQAASAQRRVAHDFFLRTQAAGAEYDAGEYLLDQAMTMMYEMSGWDTSQKQQAIPINGLGMYFGGFGITLYYPRDGGELRWVESYLTLPPGGAGETALTFPGAGWGQTLQGFIDPEERTGLPEVHARLMHLQVHDVATVKLFTDLGDAFPVHSLGWGPLETIGEFLGYMCVEALPPVPGGPPVLSAVYVELEAVNHMLRALVASTCHMAAPSGACYAPRVFTALRSSWVDGVVPGAPPVGTKLTGASHGLSKAGVWPPAQTGVDGDRVFWDVVPIDDVTASDPVIRAAARYVNAIEGDGGPPLTASGDEAADAACAGKAGYEAALCLNDGFHKVRLPIRREEGLDECDGAGASRCILPLMPLLYDGTVRTLPFCGGTCQTCTDCCPGGAPCPEACEQPCLQCYTCEKAYSVNASEAYVSSLPLLGAGDLPVGGAVGSDYMLLIQNYTRPAGQVAGGLDWWVVILVPTDPLLEAARRQRARHEAVAGTERARVSSYIARDRSMTIVMVLGVGLVCSIVATAVTQRLCVRPIVRMQAAMRDVAGMALDDAEVPTDSFMFDIRQMQDDFNAMIGNLREFRAYVPAALLKPDGLPRTSRVPPAGDIAVLFSDIKGSTALWKEDCVGMNTALETHNDAIRNLYDEHGAYEVKTIGDAFMLSFETAWDAVRMGTRMQAALAAQAWPPTLSFPDAGLVIRIGIHYGDVVTEQNPVTGRVDYRGSTVNCAARVEARALGGTTCITQQVLEAVQERLEAGGVAVADHGTHELKGLGADFQLYLCVAAAQSSRLQEATSDCFMNKVRTLPSGVGGGSRRASGVERDREPSTVSEAPSRSSGLYDASGMYRGTGLHLSQADCTVAVVKLQSTADEQMFDRCNMMIKAVSEEAVATQGMVGHLTGQRMVVSWNASRRCSGHLAAALRFGHLAGRLGAMLHVGVGSGRMLHGNVGTARLRFTTAFGAPMDAAEMAVELDYYGAGCVVADCTHGARIVGRLDGGDAVSLYRCLRLVDVWEYPGPHRRVHLYAVHMEHLGRAITQQADLHSVGSDDLELLSFDADRLQHQSHCVRTALSGTPAEAAAALHQLQQHAQAAPHDEVLKAVVAQLQQCAPVRGTRGRALRRPYVSGGAAADGTPASYLPHQESSPWDAASAPGLGFDEMQSQHLPEGGGDADGGVRAAWGNPESPMNPLAPPRKPSATSV